MGSHNAFVAWAVGITALEYGASAETDAAGVGAFTPITLADGAYSFTATATDWSGSTSAAAAPVVAMVDTAAQSPLTVNAAPPVTVADGATVEIDGVSAQPVTFVGTSGTLILTDAPAFTGQVSGLVGSDALDLADVRYGANTTAAFSGTANGGTLTVTDGTHTAQIALLGDYLGSSWTLSSDGKGGTVVVDPSLYPNATNTGVPAGVKLTPYSGTLTLSTAGQVVSGLIISNGVQINASNVTLENCIIDISNTGNWNIGVAGGLNGVVIQNCEIVGAGAAGPVGTYGIYVQGNSQVTINADNIHDVGQGVVLNDGQVLLENSYIHNLKAGSGTHYEDVGYFGAAKSSTFSLNIQNNTLINQNNQTASVFIQNYFGPVNNVTINNNILVGGDYTIYVDGSDSGGPVSNVSITNNHLGTGIFGYTDFAKSSPVFTGNVDDGATLVAAAGFQSPIVSLASAAAGSYSTGNTLPLTLYVSEAVTVSGAPTLTLNDGGTATYQSGSGTNALTFSYTVANGQNTSALAVTAVNGTIADLDGHALNTSNLPAIFTGVSIGTSGGPTIIVSSGQTSAGLDLLSGGVAKVLSGGTTINTIISSGGTEIVIGGKDFSATVNGGGVLKVLAGGSATAATVDSGGQVTVSGGGRGISAGIGSGAQLVVSAGGTDLGGAVNSGGQLSVLSGGKASGTTVIGLEVVSAGGVVVSATVENNGTLGGSGSGLGVFGIASRTLVGTDGQEAVFSGGTDIRGTVSGGGQLAVGLLGGGVAISTSVLSGGREFILSGGTGISGTLAGNDADPATFAAEIVNSGGRVSRTVVSSGGVLIVSAGGLAVSTTVNSTGIGFNRGALALSGGTASSTTINSGGQEGVFAGGTNIGATVSSDGGLFVHNGLASRTTLSGGLEVVFAGGQTVSTTVTSTGISGSSGGLANSGGIDVATVINNNAHATIFSGGTDIGATVNKGGVLYVHSGATAANTTVKSGGLEVLETGGVTTGTTVISSGGALELDGAFPSSVTYKPGAILEVGPAAVLQDGPLPTGVATAIILPGATLSGGAASSGNLVEIFGLSSNGVDRGGKVIVFSGGIDLNDTLSKGSIETLSAGAFAFATTISSGGAEIVSRGGLAVGATVMSGGKMTIASGGTDIGLSVSPGGSATVSSGGILELLSGNTTSGVTLLAGATLEVTSGAVLSGQTVSKGVTVVVLSGGTAESLNVKAGGLEIISAGGFESGSNISSGGTFEAIGNASATPHLLSGAIFEVGFGAITSVANESGVTVKVLSGGVVSGVTALFHNVVTTLNGGVVSNLTVSSGGQLIVSSGGLASGSTIWSGGTELRSPPVAPISASRSVQAAAPSSHLAVPSNC